MRVVHVSFHRDAAGRSGRALLDAWPTLAAHACAVRRAGVDITVVQAAARTESLVADDVPFQFVRHRPSRWSRPAAVLRAVRDAKPDVVHAHGLVHGAALWWLGRAMNRARIVVQDHGTRPPAGWRPVAWREALRGMTVAFTSEEQGRAWQRAGALRPRQTIIAVPEASSALTPADPHAARAVTGMVGDPAVLWLGRLDANKDPMTVLEAVARAAAARPGIGLTMAWLSGPLETAVRDRVRDDPRLHGRVTLLGRLPPGEVAPWVQGADIFVQASHHEGSGYALIEALACGTPAVVSDIAPFRALLGEPPVGRLVPVGDVDGFAAALLADHAPRAAVRAHFAAHLAWDVLGRRWRACYEELAAG